MDKPFSCFNVRFVNNSLTWNMSDLDERERILAEREEELDRLKKELEKREEDLTKWARAVSPLYNRERRQELFASK